MRQLRGVGEDGADALGLAMHHVDGLADQRLGRDRQLARHPAQQLQREGVQRGDAEIVGRVGGHDRRRHLRQHLLLREGLLHRAAQRLERLGDGADLVAPPLLGHRRRGIAPRDGADRPDQRLQRPADHPGGEPAREHQHQGEAGADHDDRLLHAGGGFLGRLAARLGDRAEPGVGVGERRLQLLPGRRALLVARRGARFDHPHHLEPGGCERLAQLAEPQQVGLARPLDRDGAESTRMHPQLRRRPAGPPRLAFLVGCEVALAAEADVVDRGVEGHQALPRFLALGRGHVDLQHAGHRLEGLVVLGRAREERAVALGDQLAPQGGLLDDRGGIFRERALGLGEPGIDLRVERGSGGGVDPRPRLRELAFHHGTLALDHLGHLAEQRLAQRDRGAADMGRGLLGGEARRDRAPFRGLLLTHQGELPLDQPDHRGQQQDRKGGAGSQLAADGQVAEEAHAGTSWPDHAVPGLRSGKRPPRQRGPGG